ncbi:MAG: BppU family phage baseplate upper protein [Nitrospiraceae bacterium]
MAFDLVAGDRGISLVLEIRDEDGKPVDLTGKAVRLRYAIDGGTVVEQTMTITDPPSGVCQYIFSAADELTPGKMEYETQIDPGTASQKTSLEKYVLNIRGSIGT